MMQTVNPIGLDKTGRKFKCPSCGQKRFVRMFDSSKNEYLPEDVGRCDREVNCGYHLTAKEYFNRNGMDYKPKIEQVQIVEPPTDYMPLEYVTKSMSGFMDSHFAKYLRSLFGDDIAERTLLEYFVGRSKNDNGKACIFWRIDEDERVRTGKIMCYDPLTGKRRKDINPTWVHTQLKPFNYKLSFYGEHLLKQYPDRTIGIVESEKTAIIASIYMPEMVWIATGGNSGCKWREWSVHKVLQDRKVILFPDFGYFNKKTERTCFDEWTERAESIAERITVFIKVSRVLEDSIPKEERSNDYDLADMLIKQEKPGGWAMTEIPGYPIMWDLNK